MLLLESATPSDSVVGRSPRTARRGGTAAVEFAICLPWLLVCLFGIWEVGRMVEVNQTMTGAVREGARQCSVGTETLNVVATNVFVYLINAEPNAFNISTTTTNPLTLTQTISGNTNTVVASTASIPEVCTLAYQNITHPTQNDPTVASQNDKYSLTLSLPYHNIAWTTGSVSSSSLSFVVGDPRLTATVNWYSLIDTPINVNGVLPVQ